MAGNGGPGHERNEMLSFPKFQLTNRSTGIGKLRLIVAILACGVSVNSAVLS
jgi:hypothetical protein